ncbi:MAG: hypothetical protein ABSD64_14785 [Terriglobales bacterium]
MPTTHDHDDHEVDGALDQVSVESCVGVSRPQAGAFEAEDGAGPEAPDFGLQKTQADDGAEESDLPIEDARTRKIAANPAIKAEIDEGRERPDVFLFGGEAAQLAGNNSGEDIQGQAGPLAVQGGGQRYEGAADAARQTAADDAEEEGGFEREVAGEKAFGDETDPDAEGDGDGHPQRKVDFVAGFTALAEDQALEFLGADERAGHGRGHAQLDEEIDEYEPRFEHGINSSRETAPGIRLRL